MKGTTMRIRLDEKHWLNSDKFCYWITEEYKIEEGKNAGNIAERRCSGYTPTFEQCVDSFIDRHVRGSEIGDFTKLVRMLRELKKTVRGWKVVVERNENE
jgi:hypothetical protein